MNSAANGMHPAAGALLWAASSEVEPRDLDLHISATHLFDPNQSPTGGAIVLAVAVTQPESIGRVRLASRDPRTAPVINYGCAMRPCPMRCTVNWTARLKRMTSITPRAIRDKPDRAGRRHWAAARVVVGRSVSLDGAVMTRTSARLV